MKTVYNLYHKIVNLLHLHQHMRRNEMETDGALSHEWWFYCDWCQQYFIQYISGLEDTSVREMTEAEKKIYLRAVKKENNDK